MILGKVHALIIVKTIDGPQILRFDNWLDATEELGKANLEALGHQVSDMENYLTSVENERKRNIHLSAPPEEGK